MNAAHPFKLIAYKYLIKFAFFFCIVILPPAVCANQKHVLVLHSYHQGLTWTDAISQGIEVKFDASNIPIEIEYAYMDTKRMSSPAYFSQLKELYRIKYLNKSFDAIISSDDHAFRFLLSNHKMLFGDSPIIFCGVNYFDDDMIRENHHFTGVLESFDMLTTINTALDLHPRAKRLVAIGDQTVSGKANKDRLEKITSLIKRPVEITILNNHSMAEIQSYVGSLTTEDIIVWLVFTVDKNGKYYSFEESTRMISTHSHAPMYAFWDFNLGHGIVGGMLTSGILQGDRAAGLALRILGGESAVDLPVIKESPNQYMFDYLQLKRFGMKLSQLPDGSKIINRPNTFYSQNKRVFWLTAIIFFSMSAIIVSQLLAMASKKKAARALVASKDRLQNVFNSASIALFEADFSMVKKEIETRLEPDGTELRSYLEEQVDALDLLAKQITVEDANPAAVQLFMASDKKELIKAMTDRIIPHHSTVMREILIALAERRNNLVWEDTFTDLAGNCLHGILSLNFPNDPKNYRNVVISVFDITDRKISEEALRRSEDRFRTVFNQAASGMALIDTDGTYLRVNGALCQMVGYDKQELLTRTWREITHENDIENSAAHMEDVLAGNISPPFEKRFIHRNGKAVHVLLNFAAIFDQEHRPLYIIAQFQDITRIKTAQAALMEREERYRQFFEDDLSGVYIAQPSGTVTICNEMFAKILGFDTKDEVLGTDMKNYYQDPEQRRKLLTQLIAEKRIEQLEWEFIRKDGTPVQCLLNASGRFDERDNLIEIQGFLVDISRMKSLEAQLLHAQKMESIGTMAGGVAHDFNNLLMGIMGNSSLMLANKDASEPDYKRLKTIEQLVQSGSDLTRQLLGFAKGGKYEVRPTDLNKLIQRSIKVFARTHKEIEVQTDLSDNLMLVEADRSQIDQVLYNLYLNAWQAMENNGQLIIQTRNRQLKKIDGAPYGLLEGNYVRISVQDNGKGMDAKIQQRIFDPFFTTKERERGTGLGLASAYGIIQNHFGSITVKSKPTEGACFTIFLPATRRKQIEVVTETSCQLIKGTETILLVDDEEDILNAVGKMLRHLGYTVQTAAGGKSAIEEFQNNHQKIDLVILDMVMPVISGKEAFERMKEIDPYVKVLLCSGYTADGQAAEIIKRGCEGYIQKPFTISQLSQKLCLVFKQQKKFKAAS